MKRLVFTFALLLASCRGGSQQPPPSTGPIALGALPLVPRPTSFVPAPGTLTIDSAKVKLAVEHPKEGDESYRLVITPKDATVTAHSKAGLYYGQQTLAQLAGVRRIGQELAPQRLTLPCGTLEDAPRYPFRVMHLDVARHFFDRKTVERYIDLLAFYRFNVFHWHLTDDQGFRLEMKKHPELTAVGGKDGFYKQEEAKAVVAYAKARGIEVIPEVDMPGHMRAVLASHPELSCTGKQQEVPKSTWGVFEDVLCAGNEDTYALMNDILIELTEVFPSKLIHVGGDEVPTTRWKECAKCKAAMQKHGVEAHGLEGVFMKRIAGMLSKLGRRPMVWDDATAAELTPDTIVTAWQSKDRGEEAAKTSHDVLMAPYQHVYFNIQQGSATEDHAPGQVGFLPWTKVRVFDPMPEHLDAAHRARILGGEGALWTEHVETPEQIDTMVMPRMAALAESLWSGPSPSEKDFVDRFSAQLPMLDASNVHYFIEPPVGLPRRKVLIAGAEAATLHASTPVLFPSGIVRYTTDGSEPTAASPILGDITTQESMKIAATLFLPSGRKSATFKSEVLKETPRPAVEVPKAEPGISCAYTEGRYFRLPDFEKLTPKLRTRCKGIGLTEAKDGLAARNVKLVDERFALRFEGYVRVPNRAVYRFIAKADDGVRIEIDGEKLVEDDGEHDARESSAEIALMQGLHKIRVTYFQGSEGKALEMRLETSTGTKLPLDLVTEP